MPRLPDLAGVSPELEALIRNVPTPDTVRELLARNRREATFLRRLLRLALDAQQAATKREIAQ